MAHDQVSPGRSKAEVIEIDIPDGVEADRLVALTSEIKDRNEVEDAGSDATRSIDAESIGIWIQLISGTMTMISTGVPLVRSLIDGLKRQGIRSATLVLPNGTKVTTDLSDAELRQLLAADADA